MKKQTLKGFFTGIVFTLCLVIGVGSVGAASKLVNIKVAKGGISIYVDEKLVKPTDVKGNVVEPFIYDGTTYLPVRAISNVLGKEITWDGKTSSVYVGKAPGAAQTDISTLNIFETEYYPRMVTGEEAAFDLLDKKITPFNRLDSLGGSSSVIYILDSKYSALKGDFVIPYTHFKDIEVPGYVKFYTVSPNGTESLIDEYKASLGESRAVNVNLAGVNILKIEINNPMGYRPVLYNIVLDGAN